MEEGPKIQMNNNSSSVEKEAKSLNIVEKSKEEIQGGIHSDKSPRHHEETHGRSDDIDETTPVDEVKAPGVLGRAKEEIEALVGAILPSKDSGDH